MAAGLRTTRTAESIGSTRGASARLHGVAALVVGAVALIVLTVLLAPATAATAATTAAAGPNPDAEYYRSTVTAIEPAVPGLDVVVHGGGESITLTNRTGRPVVVVGYSGEDYLRITADQVQVNTNSLTAALNADGGRSAPAPKLTAKGKRLPVQWRPVAAANSFTWPDFRPQWSAEQRPPIVTADPHARHEVFAWAIQLKVDSKPVLVHGHVTWIGAPWLSRGLLVTAGAAVLLLALLLTGIGLRHRQIRRRTATRVIPRARSAEQAAQSTGAR